MKGSRNACGFGTYNRDVVKTYRRHFYITKADVGERLRVTIQSLNASRSTFIVLGRETSAITL